MSDEKPFDALRLKAELGERVSRALDGLSTEERLRWIREESAKFWSREPVATSDDAQKSA